MFEEKYKAFLKTAAKRNFGNAVLFETPSWGLPGFHVFECLWSILIIPDMMNGQNIIAWDVASYLNKNYV